MMRNDAGGFSVFGRLFCVENGADRGNMGHYRGFCVKILKNDDFGTIFGLYADDSLSLHAVYGIVVWSL
jgi:hypothetical protein